MDPFADVVLEVSFTFQKEVLANTGELVRPDFGHLECELPDLLAVDQAHADSSGLNLS